MRENKILKIIVNVDKEWDSIDFSSKEVSSFFNDEKVVIIGLQGISLSYKMQKEIEKRTDGLDFDASAMFFLHMAQDSFDKIKADTVGKKIDFSLYHFYYDLFKVPKFNFKKFNFTHFAWVKGFEFKKLNNMIDLIGRDSENKTLINNEIDSTASCGAMRIDKFAEAMAGDMFIGEKVETSK